MYSPQLCSVTQPCCLSSCATTILWVSNICGQIEGKELTERGRAQAGKGTLVVSLTSSPSPSHIERTTMWASFSTPIPKAPSRFAPWIIAVNATCLLKGHNEQSRCKTKKKRRKKDWTELDPCALYAWICFKPRKGSWDRLYHRPMAKTT